MLVQDHKLLPCGTSIHLFLVKQGSGRCNNVKRLVEQNKEEHAVAIAYTVLGNDYVRIVKCGWIYSVSNGK